MYHKGEEVKMELGDCPKPVIGMSMDNNDHYFSFLIRQNEVHLFNSLDGESLNCDMITLITNSL